jgi:hypothetical protein
MATFSKQKFSESTNGRQIKVVATASSGTLIHTAHATAFDEVWLYAVNDTATDRLLTIQWGGTTATDDDIEYTVKAQNGLYLIIPGLILTGSTTIRAYCAAAANAIQISGYVNRITA